MGTLRICQKYGRLEIVQVLPTLSFSFFFFLSFCLFIQEHTLQSFLVEKYEQLGWRERIIYHYTMLIL